VTLLGVQVSFLTWDGLMHLAMPALNLALFKLSLLIRLTRASTREAVLQDYVKFARAKGLGPGRVIGVHVLKNILIPIVTVIGLELGSGDRLRDHHRVDLRLARHRQAADRLDQPARPPGDRGLPAGDRHHLHRHQLRGRRDVLGPRPARAPRRAAAH
jgi:hypothetical protein